MTKHTWAILLLVLSMIQTDACAQPSQVLRSSVPPEFINGLQAKQLQFIASELGYELEIIPMPFARRLKALENGEIDIMVGVKISYEPEKKFTYIYPSYENIETSLFVKKSQSESTIYAPDFILGLSIDNNYELINRKFSQTGRVTVSTLDQKLSLLMNDRVDGFVHLRLSGLALIQSKSLLEEIKAIRIPYLESIEYYIGMSNHSPFLDKKDKFSALIKKARANDSFTELRKKHYAQLLVK